MMKTISKVVVLVAILGLASQASAKSIKFARYPAVANDGRIAFSYHGDIWVADANGSNPQRLTAHIARDVTPRFSPDGKWIAFNSNRMGNDDIFIVSATGGIPKQLTHHSTGDTLLNWTPDGKGVLFASSRSAGTWGSPLYIAPLDGTIPKPLNMDRGASGMISQDGSKIAFNRVGFRYWRKHYRGNNNTDVWVQDLKTNKLTQLTDTDLKKYRQHTQDAHPMWGSDGMIYFMSERSDMFNIWKIDPNGGQPVQVTKHKNDGVQYPSISPDGKSIVYENEFELWKLDVASGKTSKIMVAMNFDPKDNMIEFKTSESSANSFSPSPNGEMLAVDYHGEIFIIPADAELGEKTQVTSSAWRERYQQFSPDGKFIAYISDKSGDEEIWLYRVEAKTHTKLTTHASSKRSFNWSPDSKQIVFVAENRIFMVNTVSKEMQELAHNPEGGYFISQFSADGHWLVYGKTDENLNSDVYLFDIDKKREVRITSEMTSERSGKLTPDGKTVLFTSDRSGGTSQLFAVSLTKVTEDPDDPLVKKKYGKKTGTSRKGGTGRKRRFRRGSSLDDEEIEGEEFVQDQRKKGGTVKKKATPKMSYPLKMDLENIDRRPRQLTSGSDDIRSFLLSKDGKTVFYSKSGALYSMPVAGGAEKKITDGSFSGLTLTADGKTFYFRERSTSGGSGRFRRGARGFRGRGGKISKMSVSGGSKKELSFSLRVKVDKRAEWEQVFEEAWRVMKYRFYDKEMHGYDWVAIKNRYKPLLDYVGENQDLYDLCNEMIGELNASHTGVSGSPSRSMESLYRTKNLGFEMETAGQFYRISHIYRDGPADKEWLNLKKGDFVLSIEGQKLTAGMNYYKILNNLLNDYVDIEVASVNVSNVVASDTPAPGKSRKIRIKAVSSLRSIKYEAWVKGNREYVEKISGGKIGYLHIRSMNQSSLERFKREVNQYWNKNGMVIDIRYNGGGNIDQQLIDILERKPFEYWNYRTGGRARGRRPRQAIVGPQVMLINWRSASDSEVTPQAFRDLKLGRIVGNPTYGAVIATGSYSLLNGARIRTPGSLVVTYDPSKPHNYGINLENYGVPPDVWVENSPEDELRGFDRELKASVDEALRMLKEGTWQYGEDEPPKRKIDTTQK